MTDKQSNTKCKCTTEETTGWSTVKCCNICGLPIQSEAWSFNNAIRKEVEELRDKYTEIYKKSKFLFDFNKSAMTADDITYCKNEIRMAKRIKDELNQILSK